jgi:hypothetical protein
MAFVDYYGISKYTRSLDSNKTKYCDIPFLTRNPEIPMDSCLRRNVLTANLLESHFNPTDQ